MDAPRIEHLVLWGAAFGGCDTALRAFAHGLLDPYCWLGLPGATAIGLLVAIGASKLPTKLRRVGIGLGTLLLLGFDAIAYRYQEVLGRFPDINAFRYLTELAPAWSSIERESPVLTFVLVGIATAALLALWNRLPKIAPPSWAHSLSVGVAVTVLLFTGATHLFDVVEGRAFWSTRIPAVWVLSSMAQAEPPIVFRPEDVEVVRRGLGHPPNTPPFEGAPLCRTGSKTTRGNGRSVVLLVIESLGRETLFEVADGRPVVPHAMRIATDGVLFPHVWAPGTTSDQAMPSLYAGTPPITERAVAFEPQPHFDGLPKALAKAGYVTTYVHGGDLSFLRQRSFLRDVGFDNIIELQPGDELLGWGIPDGIMFERLRTTLEELSQQPKPTFTTFATVSAHHPFDLPHGLQPSFGEATQMQKLFNVLNYSDEHLGRFYDWYLANEYERGTVLMLIGDHVAHPRTRERVQAGKQLTFEVPLILVGKGLEAPDDAATRIGAQMDVPATIRDILGLGRGRCEQGFSLFAEHFPDDRLLAANDAVDTRFLTIGGPSGSWVRDLRDGVFTIEPPGGNSLERDRVRKFSHALHDLSRWMIVNDEFAPKTARETEPQTKPEWRPPAHRLTVARSTQTEGPLPLGARNRRDALLQVRAVGLKWVSLDIAITADDQLVAVRDATLQTPAGRKPVALLTLRELRALPNMNTVLTLEQILSEFGDLHYLLEARATGFWDFDGRLAFKLAEALRGQPMDKFYLTSSDATVLDSVKNLCRSCLVGWVAPDQVSEQTFSSPLAWAADFVVLDARLDPATIAAAKTQGLGVFLVVEQASTTSKATLNPTPDAVLSDYAAQFKADGG